MSHTSLASTSYSSSSSCYIPAHDHRKPDLKSIQLLVCKINKFLDEFIVDDKARKNVKHKCSSRLKTGKQEFFEFSEQSIISNLYWGIESIEAAIQAKDDAEERVVRLKNAEKMLQVPALLSEHGVTAEIRNCYLVCSSYFYLSLVRKLQNDEWQVAIHFLQALMVSPMIVFKEFAPKLCTNIFESCKVSEINARTKSGAMNHVNYEGEVGEGLRLVAKQYKGWLMYYQVMFYGDSSRSRRVSATLPDDYNKSENSVNLKSSSGSSHPPERECSQQAYCNFEKVHPLDTLENVPITSAEESKVSTYLRSLLADDRSRTSDIRCLRDILKESQSSTPVSSSSRTDFIDDDDLQEYAEASEASFGLERTASSNPEEVSDQNRQSPSSSIRRWDALIHKEDMTIFGSGTFSSSLRNLNLSQLEAGLIESHTFLNCHMEEETSHRRIQLQDFEQTDHTGSATLQNYYYSQEYPPGNSARRKKKFSSESSIDEIFLHPEENSHIEQVGVLEKLISKLCFSENLGEEDYTVEITTVYEILNKKTGAKYSMLKDIIIDQLLMAISTSKEEGVIRTSVSILSTIISVNKSVVEDIKKKGLRLSDLVTALKRNVYEAATLIYFVNPSPAEISNLELLPVLLEVICSSNSQKCSLSSPKLTPPAASLMIIEVLITACDYATNNMHLEAISSPRVLCGLLNAPKQNNLQEFISLAAVLVRCMRFDGKCRKQISQFTPIAPVISLLLSEHKPAIYAGLEFFNEILRIPRTSAISLLQLVEKEGRTNDIRKSLLHILQSQPEHKLLAANLLLHFEMLEDLSGTSLYCTKAMEIILETMACDESPATQKNSAFILSNLGGTYAWTGEPYTVAWLVKKAGLSSLHHKNTIRNIDWSDQSIQDAGTDTWSSKIARQIIKFGKPVFHALVKGLQSNSKRIARECLITLAWLGCEIAKTPNDLRYSACEILLDSIEQYVHPGLELEDRLLACLCIYNYASGRAMQKLVHFSEGVRESLRRLSSITWMAEELLKVADYLQPDKWRISCVHTQVLEMGNSSSGSVNALIYFRGELYSGYADGSIKTWDVKGQSATLVRDIKAHKKAVTCFSLLEPQNCLLTGSADKTIRMWQMVEQKLECIQVIAAKSSVQSIDTSGNMIFVVTQGNNMKVFDTSKKDTDVYKKKNVKCINAKEGKYYLGCLDSSLQEVTLINNRHQELKAPIWSWRIQRKSINSIALYKDWLYSASSVVEGSSVKEWRRNSKPQMLIVPGKSTTIAGMRVVEDFIYLQCSSSANSLQIWLRGTQHKVGRLSAGSKITSLLTANDMVLCGTETGLIKGWIPL